MKDRRQLVSKRVREIPPSGIREFFELVIGKPGVISLGVGEPDFVTPWTIRESAIFSLEQGYTSYTSNWGLLELREEIAGYLAREWKAEYDPAREILVTVGVSEAVDIVLRSVLDPGDEVVITEPCYVSYSPLVYLAGGVPVSVPGDPADGFQPRLEDLQAAITPRTKLLFVNFPNNPTGAVLSRERAEAIAKLVVDRDILLLTDEIYGELTYDQPHHSLASFPGMKERTLLLHGFSKAFAMTGWRLGFIAAPHEILEGALKIHQYCALCAPIMAQKAALEALRHGIAPMTEMRKHYNQRRKYIHERLTAMNLECGMPGGAFYIYPSVKSTGLDGNTFARALLQEKSVAVVPGDAFGPSGREFIRCAYAASMDNIKIAMDRMEEFVKDKIRNWLS